MAIVHPFECCILVNGVRVKEYDDQRFNPTFGCPATSKYIEAVAGDKFVIGFGIYSRWLMRSDYLVWNILLDGRFNQGAVITREKYSMVNGVTDYRDGQLSGRGTNRVHRPFIFAELEMGRSIAYAGSPSMRLWCFR